MGCRADIASGRIAFAHLIRMWHARNGWSHRVLPSLAEHLDLGRVHNSQLSMLRNGKLASPGPEVFLALGGINRWLAEQAPAGQLDQAYLQTALAGHPDLIEALATGADAVRDPQGGVLGAGDLLEVFVGLRPAPPAFNLSIREEEAATLSAALADLLTAGRPWRQCRDELLAAYPVGRRGRRDRFAAVMAGQQEYGATELEAELPDLRRTLAQLGGSVAVELGPERFLELLRNRAHSLDENSCIQPQAVDDLATAIRRKLAEE
ncbi:MAG: hypothetical protein NTZ40_07060 [Cyanobacteria bacterium]|nr:hypothetical protein [Cyanobacteriota bacterium]